MVESAVSPVPARGPRVCRVDSIDHLTPDSVSVVLHDETGEPFEFAPGQFFMVTVNIDGQPVRRTYSATSAPGEFGGGLRLGVKRRPGGLVSNYINDRLKPGDVVTLKGPGGKFVPDRCRLPRHLVLVAGGSGITPMMSMIRTMLQDDCSASFTLIYGNRDMHDVMYADELAELAATYAGRLRIVHVLTRPCAGWTGLMGALDIDMLRRILADLPKGDEFLVCGSPGMMEAVRQSLVTLGIDPARIRTETFSVPEDI